MARRYFGTDGIRGSANSTPMTSEVALRVGMAAGKLFTNGSYRHRVVIGKDTRLSGYMIEAALVSGFTAVGMDVFLLGPMPTPAVAMLTRSLRADLGVMISASHNPFADNGIKLFGPDGYKLSDDTELQVEELMLGDMSELLAAPREDRQRDPHRQRARALYRVCQAHAAQEPPLRRHQGGDRLRQWRGLQGCARGAVGAWRRCGQGRRRSERLQHQQGLRLDRTRRSHPQGQRSARRYRHRARRRRRPRGHRRREGPHDRRRSAHGGHRRVLAPARTARRRRHRRHGHVQSRA